MASTRTGSAAITLVLGLALSCGPGPGKLAIVKEPGVNNVHLAIWNPGPSAVRLLVTLNDRILFDERVEPTPESGPAAQRWTTLASRRYRIEVLDRLSGRTGSGEFDLGSFVNIHLNVLPDGIVIVTSEDPKESIE